MSKAKSPGEELDIKKSLSVNLQNFLKDKTGVTKIQHVSLICEHENLIQVTNNMTK